MSINLAQLKALPIIIAGLSTVFSATGSVTVQNLLTKAQELVKAVQLDSATVTAFNSEVNAFINVVGDLFPGAALSNVKAEIATYESDLVSLAGGQNLEVADVKFSLNGSEYDAVVSVALKREAQPLPVAA